MEFEAVRTRQHRLSVALGIAVSTAAHLAALAVNFEVPGTSAGTVAERSPAPVVARRPAVEIVRFATRSRDATEANALYGGSVSAPSPQPPSSGSGSADPAVASQVWAQPSPVTSILSEPPRMAFTEFTTGAPVVFENLEAISPDPVVVGVGSDRAEDDGQGGWLSGLAGIFGGGGVSLDGGICPVPRGRAGWR